MGISFCNSVLFYFTLNTFLFGKKRVYVNDLWGNINVMKNAIRNGFLYDVEEMLKM